MLDICDIVKILSHMSQGEPKNQVICSFMSGQGTMPFAMPFNGPLDQQDIVTGKFPVF